MQQTTDRPAFELGSYEDQTLAHNVRLNSLGALVGHTITHVFEDLCDTEEPGQAVLVTATGCWIVLDAEDSGYSDEEPVLKVVSDGEGSFWWRRRGRTANLSDYVEPQFLFEAGLINEGELNLLKAQRRAKEEAKREKEAANLRAQLARLEGGAA